jgi:hypothetical protein
MSFVIQFPKKEHINLLSNNNLFNYVIQLNNSLKYKSELCLIKDCIFVKN